MSCPRWPILLGLTALTFWTGNAFAQATRPSTNRPAPSAPVVSPEVHPDRTVSFRLRAPKAEEVIVAGQWGGGRVALAKDDSGIWNATVGPIAPGVYEYSITVDDLQMIDPGNPAIKPMRQPRTSILHLPGSPPLLHDFQEVPHGVVRSHTYLSQSLGRQRELCVYTPPGYDQARKRYPTLYLQHGSGDNQDTWTVHGKAHWILDNLIAQKHAQPMVVVMMDGHAALSGGAPGERTSNTAAFERDLLEDVLPWIEKQYRVRSDAASRAIAGLSMGGGQSLTVGLNHADTFAWVAGFSSSVPSPEAVSEALTDAAATNRKLRLLWIACGNDDFLLARNQDFIKRLQEANVRHDWQLTEGDHSWPVWRRYLAELAPRLFTKTR